MSRTTKWLGDRICDFCHDPITPGQKHQKPWFVDGKTRLGPWALMCSNCFQQNGIGLGVGRGQRYDSTTLEKVEG